LIYERFITSQMSDAQFETETVLIRGGKRLFVKATRRRLLFDGFYKMIGL